MAALDFRRYGGTTTGISFDGSARGFEPIPVVVLEKKMTPEEEAAEIMAKARNKRIEEVKEKFDAKLQDYRSQMKMLTVLRKTKKLLYEEYMTLARETKGQLVNEYREVITQLKISELITTVDVDEEKRLIFTTRPIIIKKEKWKHARLAGVYQIRIDFSKSSYDDAIEILNITQRESSHDHPHVTDTHACWGNVGHDISKDFQDKNTYELVIDIVDYLQSGADNDGFLQYNGTEEELKKEFGEDEKDGSETSMHAWEQFLTKAKKMPPGFCFAMYKQQKKEKKSPAVATNSEGGLAFTPIEDLVTTNATLQQTATAVNITYGTSATSAWQLMSAPYPYSPYGNNRVVSYYQSEIARQLQELGLTEKAAWHFMDYLKPSENRWIDRLELINRGDVFWLMVFGGPPPQPLSLMMQEESVFPSMPLETREIQRIFINTTDIKPETLTEFGERGTRAVRIGLRLNDEGQREIREQRMREEMARHAEEHLRQQGIGVSERVRQQLGEITSDEELEAPQPDVAVTPNVPDEEFFKQEFPSKSPEAAMHHYGIVAGSDKKKTTKFGDIKKTLNSLLQMNDNALEEVKEALKK